ncbi:MAG: family 20 glycosylhydrolase, partial [Spirochaetaceae bacterium]|nr:family 20 glycosylhydrolase [Spirochaetaceae bacterium]
MRKSENIFDLVPQPLSIKASDAYFIFKPELTAFCPDELQGEIAVFNEQLEASTPFKCRLTSTKTEAVVIIELNGSNGGDEAYKLKIGENAVTINAGEAHGVFNALQTLRQILMCCQTANEGNPLAHYSMQCAEIEDSPRFEWRGFMLDCARTFFPVSFIKKLIDVAALHKLNRFHWHLTDDQGWRIPVNEYPKLIEIGSVAPDPRHQLRDYTPKKDAFYTHEQMKDVISYAAARHITIVPEIELP